MSGSRSRSAVRRANGAACSGRGSWYGSLRAGSARRGPRRSGQSLVEFVLLTPILLLMMLGLIEFAQALDAAHSMASLSREGANLAARGTPIDTVPDVVIGNGGDIGLDANGGVIATSVRVEGGVPTIKAQAWSTGFTGTSLIGEVGERAAALDSLGLLEGGDHYVVEIFYRRRNITPVHRMLGSLLPEVLYDRAVF